jgi:hypothetical protein
VQETNEFVIFLSVSVCCMCVYHELHTRDSHAAIILGVLQEVSFCCCKSVISC